MMPRRVPPAAVSDGSHPDLRSGERQHVPPDNEAIVSVTFNEDRGITTVTTRIDFGSKEARDGAVGSGMTDGMEHSYQLLDALL